MKINLPIHPNLKADIEKYKAARDFVLGDVINSNYIVPYSTDYKYDSSGDQAGLNQHYSDRVKRSYNINLTEAVLEQHRITLAQPMSLGGQEESEELQDFISDVDGEGSSLDDFIRQTLWEYGGLGTAAILTEAPVMDPDGTSRLFEAEQRPYWRLYSAFQVRYWERFEFGSERGKVRQVILENAPQVDAMGESRRHFLWYYFPEGSGVYSVREVVSLPMEENDKETGENFEVISDEANPGGLSEIPVVILGGSHSDSFTCRIWPLNHALLNRLSVLTNINYHHGFPKVFVTGVSDSEEFRKSGEYIVNSINNPNAKVLQLEPGNPSAVFEEIRMLLHNIKLIAGFKLTQLTADDTRQTQSAESKSKDLQLLANFYNDTALYLERKFSQAMTHVATFLGVEEEINVQIGRDFGLEDDALDLAMDELVLSTVTAYLDEASANEVVKAITLRRISDMRIAGVGDETENETRQRLREIIANASPKASRIRGLSPLSTQNIDSALDE